MKDTKKRKKKRSRKPEAEAGTAAESRMREISEIPEEAGDIQNPEALPEVRDAGLADQDAEPAVRDEVFADQDAGPEADPAEPHERGGETGADLPRQPLRRDRLQM